MIRILKNKTNSDVSVAYGNVTVIIEANSQRDLAETFEGWQLASSESLLLLLGQGVDNYQLNDGTSDLDAGSAIDLIRGYQQKLKVNDNEELVTDIGVAKTSSLMIRASLEKPEASRLTIISHDWSDPTTWYETSIRVVDEIPTNTGDNQKYKLSHSYIIDNYHGKLSKEDYLKDKDGYSLRVSVKVNSVTKTEQDPHYGTGGDFTVNYDDGYIDFISPLIAEDEVKVTYHYMLNSIFTFKPSTGKLLRLLMAEVQFAEDTTLTDSVVFQPRGKVDVFAPQLVDNPYPSGTLISIENPTIYKTFSDFQNDATKVYPVYQVIGGSNWRAATKAVVVFNWDYVGAAVFRSSYGMEIQLRTQHDIPLGGFYATATFYCIVENE